MMRGWMCALMLIPPLDMLADEPPLPPREVAIQAISSDPRVLQSADERDAFGARAAATVRGPHEWALGGALQQRDINAAGTYDEWEISLQRGWRLPGKSSVDRQIAAKEIDAAQNAYEDAWHVSAVELLDAWFDWLRADAELDLATQAYDSAERELAMTEKRVGAGDAARMDFELAKSNAAGARADRTRAMRDVDIATRTLQTKYPTTNWPQSPPSIDAPTPAAEAEQVWIDRILSRSHEVGLRRAEQERAEARAERARLDRTPDPVIGVRMLNERGGDERALTLTFSQSFGGSARRAEADAQRALARAAANQTRRTIMETQTHATAVARRATADLQAWREQREALLAADTHYQDAIRAYELGEIGLADLLTFARLHQQAARSEISMRLEAHYSRARMEIDAHERWRDEL